MKPTQTGIAVAIALVVIVVVFFFPGLLPFGQPQPSEVAVGEEQAVEDLSIVPQGQPTPLPTMPSNTQPLTQLMMKDIVVGTGETATAGDNVTVNYVGALTNGTVFDASAKHGSEGFTFTLGAGQVIKGWDQGVAGMKVGGKRVLAIPAALAYGAQAVGNVIPANADLIFEVELLKVTKGAK